MKMRMIHYRGGLVRFRIPAQWSEVYDDDGGGAFYDDEPNSPTLRLDVLELRSPRPVDDGTTTEMLASRAERTGESILLLDTGNAVIADSEFAEEDGHDLLIYYWELANAVPPTHGRLAIFSLTILRSQQFDQEVARVVELIEREVMSSEFATEPTA